MEKRFCRNHLYFGIYADFEADIEVDNSSIGNKTTNIYKQNPVLNGYYIISELDDFFQSSHYKSLLRYDNVGWFVIEVIELEKKAFYFKNTKKDIIMTEKVEEEFKNNSICRFCEKILYPIKLEIIVI